ncbi:MAG: glutamate-5-semialdehyde dehydrogenase [Candidatus Pelagibacter sp.]|nr:glutamate-5-semialdehyde dehydrogenase [Candidatus Pelagibacter sp.]OUV97365.1 MAG: glutamate-5-semialdehyde dehydrogenase [Candidatus Pelagibacter sp. TMED142]
MNKLKYLKKIASNAKKASNDLSKLTNIKKNKVLEDYLKAIKNNKKQILQENNKDINNSRKNRVKENLIDRAMLNNDRIKSICKSIEEVISFKDPNNKILSSWKRPNGLLIQRISMPLGVIAVIYESRPNVTADVSVLCFKSGNAAILRGGKEAFNTNIILSNLFRKSLNLNKLNPNCIQLINKTDRVLVDYLLSKMSEYIDVIIPRGGKGLVKKVLDLSTVPTIGHLEGLCHIYIDNEYSFNLANKIIINSKLRRTSICGAAETLLFNEKIKKCDIHNLLNNLHKAGCKIIADKKIHKIFNNSRLANSRDWKTEYLDSKISVKSVKNVDEAIRHIKTFGTNHTECIISSNKNNIDKFFRDVPSSIVMNNASTQFADGYEFGLGSEVGISTSKLHPRGPVGLEQLTTYKFVVKGTGQIRN